MQLKCNFVFMGNINPQMESASPKTTKQRVWGWIFPLKKQIMDSTERTGLLHTTSFKTQNTIFLYFDNFWTIFPYLEIIKIHLFPTKVWESPERKDCCRHRHVKPQLTRKKTSCRINQQDSRGDLQHTSLSWHIWTMVTNGYEGWAAMLEKLNH